MLIVGVKPNSYQVNQTIRLGYSEFCVLEAEEDWIIVEKLI